MNKKLMHNVWAAILAAALSSGAMAQTATPPGKPAPERLVLCWYMVCYGSSVEFYKQEMELAQRHGIDGFVLDVGAWGNVDQKSGEFKPGNYVQSAERMYEAAKQLNSGFKLLMGPEYSVQPVEANVEDMVRRFQQHPNQLLRNGKIVISGYGISAPQFRAVQEKLQKEGIDTSLILDLFPPRFEYAATPERIYSFYADYPYMDGLMSFDARPAPEVIRDNAVKTRVSRRLNKIHAAAVIPAYNSANLEDMRGLSGYGAMWEGAMRDGVDWISIIIWNDYNEDSGLMPHRWPSGQDKAFFDRDESFLNATAYYSAWFKTGERPSITQDKIFLTYRNRSKWLRQAWNPEKNEWVNLAACPFPFDQIHDNVDDNIYIDTFLTAPAVVTLKVGGSEKTFDLSAGVGHAEAPMTPGVPKLTLSRQGKILAEVTGRKLIVDKTTEENSSLGGSQHLLNRTWASGTAVGPAIRVEAESGTVHSNASVVKVGAVATVATVASDGSGFTVPVKGLKTATYNVRIIYCNPAETEARLTLMADGASRANKDYPYFIPAFLPPTGKDKFETVSFLWSLYETTTFLKMQWEQGRTWGGKLAPGMDDRGSVQVDAIELVKVDPFLVPVVKNTIYPELVPIEGGTFTMGGSGGEPDEVPAHKVKVSPFAIGKYEVTNEEFEKFDPKHREFRTSLSWRNREPVIAVSWVDAAKYCNWLSEQAGLTPVYAEMTNATTKAKQWETDLKADGFRLPTEAEWEYVATGRGEGRKYPWGNEAPEPGKHGNFEGRKALEFEKPLPSSEGGGAMVVGSYPAGASRDGVMDLAGNVGEWCSDWYSVYPAEDQTDPCGSAPGNYRSIRGGTWGWYNYSQRSSDREFNNPGYPGHCYYGFRVVVSEAGWRKLQKK